MKKSNRIYFILLFIVVCLFQVFKGISTPKYVSPLEMDSSQNTEETFKQNVIETLKVGGDVISLCDYDMNLSLFNQDEEFANLFIEQALQKDDTSFAEYLIAFAQNGYNNETVWDKLSERFFASANTLEEKFELCKDDLMKVFGNSAELFTYDEISTYVNNNAGELIFTEKEHGGYYDNLENRHTERYREISRGGDIITTSYYYGGDFARDSYEREYLDSYYQIHTEYDTSYYFRGKRINLVDSLESYKMINQYLVEIQDGRITFYYELEYSWLELFTVAK